MIRENNQSLRDARLELQERLSEGTRCPCCGQFAKIYRRKIHATMARELILIYRRTIPGEWFHLPTVVTRGGDVAKLVHWGLLEEENVARPDGGRAGWWRLTADGVAFARGTLTVPKYALIYDSKCLGLEGEPTSIQQALGDRFSYEELMHG